MLVTKHVVRIMTTVF